MKINVFADTICGWCFIGHTNLNNALEKFPNIKFDIQHVPFQLNPDMPTEGISREKYQNYFFVTLFLISFFIPRKSNISFVNFFLLFTE